MNDAYPRPHLVKLSAAWAFCLFFTGLFALLYATSGPNWILVVAAVAAMAAPVLAFVLRHTAPIWVLAVLVAGSAGLAAAISQIP
ncbi:MAG TPA: hypothetical protein PLS69_03045 [Terricaulis sp.]|nr:hypothetical protein [Terricaulis sp.]